MRVEEIRPFLIKKLKDEHRFWSYESDSVNDVPDDILIEKVLIYLDLDDIDKLFQLLPYEQIRKSWIDNLIPLGERYYSLNRFLALYYFNARKPGAYVKSMMTRHLNKLAKGMVWQNTQKGFLNASQNWKQSSLISWLEAQPCPSKLGRG